MIRVHLYIRIVAAERSTFFALVRRAASNDSGEEKGKPLQKRDWIGGLCFRKICDMLVYVALVTLGA